MTAPNSLRFATFNASLHRDAEGQLIDPLLPLVGDFNPNVPPTGFPSSDRRLVRADVVVDVEIPDSTRQTVTRLDFLGEVQFETGLDFKGTQIGGLSGITYDPFNRIYYAISDDRSQINQARFYTLNIDLSDRRLDNGDIAFTHVTTLLNASGIPFPERSIDSEGIAFNSDGTLFISSEGDANNLLNPFVNEFSLSGQQFGQLTIPNKFLTNADKTEGIRNNLAFESLTITPDERYLYTAVESALIQDGSTSTLEEGSPVRILQYDLATGKPGKEFLYFTDPIPNDSNPPGGFADNGLVELIALDNTGTFLALERSFASGVGNSLRLYEVRLQGATDVSNFNSLLDADVDAVAQKRLLIDFGELGIRLDNSEGMTLGPVLPDGRRSLIVVSDNNFSNTQITQFLAFVLDIDSIPSVTPTVETPSEVRYNDPNNPDADDPTIYVHPTDPSRSLVIATLKDGGLAVYDLNGEELQQITPIDIRYNNVDLVYGFTLNGTTVDLAIASDRANDTLAIFQIDPTTRQLTDITAPDILATIFGEDDGEQTAYGLATYKSPVSGKNYVFVSQREGDKIAQLELIDHGSGRINAQIARIFTVPIPDDGEVEDAQVEGMVVDRELGYLYVAQEGFGIWKFAAEPNAGDTGTLVDTVREVNPNSHLEADAEGLTIYYGADGKGYLFASSQGNSTFTVYDRQGSNSFLGNFVVGEGNGIDSVEESDGADIINVPLGGQFPLGLMVVHDGSNDPAVIFPDPDDGEIQNFNTNFKYVSLENLADTLPFLNLDPNTYNPRNPSANSLINGIASGDTTQTTTILWARSTFLGNITFEYSTDPNFSTLVGTATATITDINLPVKVEVTGLTPSTDYYYRITDVAGDTAIGTFETAARLGTKAGLRFGVSGDWRGELAPYPAISNAPARDLDFFVEHGDTIYADYASDAVRNPDGTRKEQAETLLEYRAKNSEVYSSRFGVNSLGDLRAATSVFATIDDHEVINDFSGGVDVSTDPRFNDPPGTLINDSTLYENGLQAFQEYNPIRDEFYGDTGDERTAGERKLYRYRTYGSDAAAIILDNRSFRDNPLASANVANPADIARFLTQSLTLDRTMLGDAQLQDLKQDLLDAENKGITWKFIMVPEPIQNLGPAFAEDRFEGYAKERTEILKFINDNDIDNVVFIAADIHGTVVNNLTYQVTPGGTQIATNAFEISTGAVAFDAPFGPTVIDIASVLGSLTPQQKAFYDSLPVANDTDSLINDKDDFLKQIIDRGLTPFGYDPVGLNANLPIAQGSIDATLLQGDYVATHTFGWTEFDIDPQTQQLRVITYGIDPYSEAELLANPTAIISGTPQVVSEFVVNPVIDIVEPEPPRVVFGTPGDDNFDTSDPNSPFDGNSDRLFTGSGNDRVDASYAFGRNRIDLGSGDDIVYAGTNNRLIGGKGDDRFYLGGGGNRITGGIGADRFWVTTDDANLPGEANIITDFKIADGDTIGFYNTHFSLADRGNAWDTRQVGNNTIIEVFGQDVAVLQGIRESLLSDATFIFG